MDTTAESYDPFKVVKIQREENVDIGEKSPQFCIDRVTKSPHSGNEKTDPVYVLVSDANAIRDKEGAVWSCSGRCGEEVR